MFPSKVSVHTHIKRFYHRGVVDEMALRGFSLGILTSSCSLKRSILGNWLLSFGCMNGCLRLCVSPMTNLWLAQCTLRLAPWKLEKGSSSPWKKMFELDLQVLVYTSWGVTLLCMSTDASVCLVVMPLKGWSEQGNLWKCTDGKTNWFSIWHNHVTSEVRNRSVVLFSFLIGRSEIIRNKKEAVTLSH